MSRTDEEDDAVCMDHDAALDEGTAFVYKQPMTIKPNDVVMWCKTRYIVVDAPSPDNIWGYRFDQPSEITPVLYLLGYPEDMEVVGKMLGTVE